MQDLFKSLEPRRDKNLLVGIDTMDDASVYRISAEQALITTVDYITPITDDPFRFGQVAAANSLSDVYAMGGRPMTVLNICNFPASGADLETLGKILKGGLDKVHEAGALLVGGHTVRDDELKYGLSVTGMAHPERITPNSGAKVGDALILTKPMGTGVHITASKRGMIGGDVMDPVVEAMATLNKTAAEVMVEFGCAGCTDITGFGLGGHALEMARASRVGIRFVFDAIPKFPETMALIEAGVATGVTKTNLQLTAEAMAFKDDFTDAERTFFADPQTSGGLLIAVQGAQKEALLKALQLRGVKDAAIIGEVFEADPPRIEVVRA